MRIALHPAYLRLVSSAPQNGVLNSLLVALLWRVAEQPDLLLEIAAIWNRMVSNVPLTAEEIEQLNAIAFGFDLPFQLNAQGQLENLP